MACSANKRTIVEGRGRLNRVKLKSIPGTVYLVPGSTSVCGELYVMYGMYDELD